MANRTNETLHTKPRTPSVTHLAEVTVGVLLIIVTAGSKSKSKSQSQSLE